LNSEDVIVTGFVEDLDSLLDRMRVSIAPLRYGAGIKGKIGSAMAVGLPVVATALATEGMSLTDGENVLVADDVHAFASAVASLYQNEALWVKFSKVGLEFTDRAWGAERAWNNLADILAEIGLHSDQSKNKLSLYASCSTVTGAERNSSRAQPPGAQANTEYSRKLQQELSIYEKQLNVHDLPSIFHYWSNTHLAPIFADAGIQTIEGFFIDNLLEATRRTAGARARFVSIGSGNCDLELNVAKGLVKAGCRDFILECVEINPAMLDRGAALARSNDLSANMQFVEADFNLWRPSGRYDAVIANQSLHHVTNLEHLYDEIKTALKDDGSFVISDIIGRNGHQRWPESLEIVDRFWKELPDGHRFNVILNRHEKSYENWDCSTEGFEGIRAQDVLPLLMKRFECEKFVGFGSAIDIFVDRAFGHHFDPESEWDRDFIDRVHAEDESGLRCGRLTPTHMMSVFVKRSHCTPYYSRGIGPLSSIRKP